MTHPILTPLALGVIAVIYGAALLLVWRLEGRARRFASGALPLGTVALFLLAGSQFSPFERLLFSTVLLLGLLKCAVALRRSQNEVNGFSRLGLLVYFFVWPGLEMRPFARWVKRGVESSPDDEQKARDLFRGATGCIAGLSLFMAIGWFGPQVCQPREGISLRSRFRSKIMGVN